MELTSAIVSNPAKFIFGGNASFTIRNNASKVEFQYRIIRSKNNSEIYYVQVKNGHSFEYAGFIQKTSHATYYSKGSKGLYDANTPAIKGILYAIKHGTDALNTPMQMTHHGRCACCGKALTDTESVIRGFGPICYKRIF